MSQTEIKMSSTDYRYYCLRHGWRVLSTNSEGVAINTSQFADHLNDHNLECVCTVPPLESYAQPDLSESFNASQSSLTAHMEALQLQTHTISQLQLSTTHHHHSQQLETQHNHVKSIQTVQLALNQHPSPTPEIELDADPDHFERLKAQPFVDFDGHDGHRPPQLPLNLNPEMQAAYYTETDIFLHPTKPPPSQNQSTAALAGLQHIGALWDESLNERFE